MAGINSLVFLLSTLAPLQESPEDVTVPYDVTLNWRRGFKPTDRVFDGFPQRDCQNNEEWSLCLAACKNRRNCQNRGRRIICTPECVSGCVCKEGMVRGPEGSCVFPHECPAFLSGWFFTCKENERYTQCLTSCEDSCDNFMDQNRICKYLCGPLPGCQCKAGFVRGPDGHCVKPDQCPRQPKDCFEKEEYLECGSACPRNCTNYDKDERCIEKCVPGCFCKYPLVRAPTGQCMLQEQCPLPIPEHCPEGEEHHECGTACPKNCTNYDKDYPCIERCHPGCFCKDPLIRGPTGKCILPQDCTSSISEQCPDGEEYLVCGTACSKNCTNYDEDYPCIERCVPGCFCKDPLIRGPTGKCILPKDCSLGQIQGYCGRNEEFSFATSVCQDDCDKSYNRWHLCKFFMRPGCVCKKGFIRGKDGDCIDKEQCSPGIQPDSLDRDVPQGFCGINEKFSLYSSLCPDSCDNYKNPMRPCNLLKFPGCKCTEGYVKDRSNVCIKKEQCIEGLPEDCTEKEKFDECGSYCEADCSQDGKAKCEDERCRKGCVCKPGMVRGPNWECIPPTECPNRQNKERI